MISKTEERLFDWMNQRIKNADEPWRSIFQIVLLSLTMILYLFLMFRAEGGFCQC